MKKYYATSLDVCCGEILAEMNRVELESNSDFYKEAKKLADNDIAHFVEIGYIENGKYTYVGEYEFPEYKCDCEYLGQIDVVENDE